MKHRKTLVQLLALCILMAQLLGVVPAAAYAEEPAPAAQQEEVEAPAEETGEEYAPDEDAEDADKAEEAAEETPAGKPEDADEELPPELEEEVAGEEMPTLLAAEDDEKDDLNNFKGLFIKSCVTEAGSGNVIGRTNNASYQTSLVIAVDKNQTYTFRVKNDGKLSVILLSEGMVAQATEPRWIGINTNLGTNDSGTAGTITNTEKGTVRVSGASYLVLNINSSLSNSGLRGYYNNTAVENGGYIAQYEDGAKFQPLTDRELYSKFRFVMLYSGNGRLTSGDPDPLIVGETRITSGQIPLNASNPYLISVNPGNPFGSRYELTVFVRYSDNSVEILENVTDAEIKSQDNKDVSYIYLMMRVKNANDSTKYENLKNTDPRMMLDAISIQENQAPTASLIKMANLNLDGTINLNLYALFDGVTSLEAHPYMLFEVPGSDGSTHEVKVNVNSTDTMESDGKTYYRFTLPLAAKQMADVVQASLWDDTGWISKKVTYSVRTYCDNMIKKENSTPDSTTTGLVPMLYALLDYGAAAQQHFNYRVDALANKDLPANSDYSEAKNTALSTFEQSTAFATQVSGEGVGLSVNLNLEEEVTLNVLIAKADAEGSTAGLKLQVNGNAVDFTEYNNDYYCAKITGITAPRLRNMYSFYVTHNGERISKEYCSGPFSYAKQVLASSSDESLKNLMKSMVAYHYLAWNYLKVKYPNSYQD